MKISELSKLSGTSVDTIRYYISLGLLNPIRKNSQYCFSEHDLNDILRIQELKDMRFSLKEIETVIRFGRTSNWVEPILWREYGDILRKKSQDLRQEQQSLQDALHRISSELEKVAAYENSFVQNITGVPLQALPLLVCPNCGKTLQIQQAFVSQNYVMSGMVLCPCGYRAEIEQGILKTGHCYLGPYDSPDLDRQLYSTLCSELLKMYQQCSSYIMAGLRQLNLQGKTVLESCINGYFFLYNHFAQLPKDCLYIVTDKYPEMLLMYKALIERLNLNLSILYIADNTAGLPLAKQSVDVCVDFFSCTDWSLYHQGAYPLAMNQFFAPECWVFGSFMDVASFSKSKKNLQAKYPECDPEVFSFPHLCQLWENEAFSVRSQLCSQIKSTQNSYVFTCHADGEDLNIYTYRAHRKQLQGSGNQDMRRI